MNTTPPPPQPPTSDGPIDLATQRAISAALSNLSAADDATKNAHIAAALQAFDDMPIADRAAVASGRSNRNWLASAAAAVVLAATAGIAGYLVNGNGQSNTTVAAENDATPTRNTATNPCGQTASGAQFLNTTTIDGVQVHLYLRTGALGVEVVLLNAETCFQENSYVLTLSGG